MDFPKISTGVIMAYLALPIVVGLAIGSLASEISKLGQNTLNKGNENQGNSVKQEAPAIIPQDSKAMSDRKVVEGNNSSSGVMGWALFSGCLLAGLATSLSLAESLRPRW